MKTKIILLIIPFITSAMNVHAQNSGKIVFEKKSKLNINIDTDNQAILNNLPKEHITKKELIFDSTASLFRKMPDQGTEETVENETGHGKMVIKMSEPEEFLYCDMIGKKRIEQREFMSRKFLIEIPFSASNWKLTGQQKIILGYPCQEAVLQDTARKVRAWFTPAIPLPTGPNGICNLPGIVLAAEFNDGEVTYEAKSISFGTADNKLIVKPTEGKRVTREEFNQIVMEKNKEMEEQGDGNGNVIIRVKK